MSFICHAALAETLTNPLQSPFFPIGDLVRGQELEVSSRFYMGEE